MELFEDVFERIIIMNKLKNAFHTRYDSIDKLYFIMNLIFCIAIFLCGFFTRHTCDYSAHSAGLDSVSFRPYKLLMLIYKSGYPLWFLCGGVICRVLSCSSTSGAGICTGLWLIISFLGLLYYMRKQFDEKVNKYLVANLCFILLIVGPIWIPWKYKYIIWGCGGPNVWHNATNICGRAVGIFVFFFCIMLLKKMIESDYTYIPSLKICIFLSFLLLFSLFAKPSFIQSFGPSFAILLVYHLIKSKGAFIKQFLVFCAASILPLLYLMKQFFFYFSTSSTNPGLKTMDSGKGIIIKFLPLSNILGAIDCHILILMFPMIMVVLMGIKGKLDIYHAVVWLMHFFATTYAVVLHGAAEGEMGWAVYIAYFFVYLIGIRDFIYLYFTDYEWKNAKFKAISFSAALAVLVANILVGLIYLYLLIVLKNEIF